MTQQNTPEIQNTVDLTNSKKITELFRNKALVYIPEYGEHNPLCQAVSNGCVEDVRTLLSVGADPNETTVSGRTLLATASAVGNVEIIDLLIKAGANINAKGNIDTPLSAAVEQCHTNAVEKLINVGVNIEATSFEYLYTPLHIASRCGYSNIVNYLLEAGSNPNSVNYFGWTPLHLAAACGKTEVVRSLVSRGANINIRDNEGKTPLYRGINACKDEVLSILLKAGADPDIVDNEGDTPLIYIMKGGLISTIKVFVKAGANINVKGKGDMTAAHHAAKEGYVSILRVLYNYGSDMLAKDEWGRTPLDIFKEKDLELYRSFFAEYTYLEDIKRLGKEVHSNIKKTGYVFKF